MKRKRNSMLDLLSNRQLHSGRAPIELQEYVEDKAAHFVLHEMPCKLPVSVRSTFLMCFSPNGSRVASTHGDHRIYVCQVSTGKLLKTLEGHPRTPWCLAFHPTCNDLLASGCLGGEVRVWDLRGGGSEVWLCPERSVITSLSFHPMENFIALSTMNRVHFWDWSTPEPFATTKTNSEREKVRLVRFTPQGDRLLTGITNAPPDRPYSHRRSSILCRLMTMYHRLGEMLPSPQSPSLQRRIARRAFVRRVDDIVESMRTRANDLQSSEPHVRPSERLRMRLNVSSLRRVPLYQEGGQSPGGDAGGAGTANGGVGVGVGGSSSANPLPGSSSTSSPRTAPYFHMWPSFMPTSTFGSTSTSTSTSSPTPTPTPTPSPTPTSTSSSAPSTAPTMSSSSSTDQSNRSPQREGQQRAGSNSSSSSSSSNGSRGENAELWDTFNRLRFLCTRLESRMMRHSFPDGTAPGATAAAAAAAGAGAGANSSANSSSLPTMTPNAFSNSQPGQPSTSRIFPASTVPPPPPPPPPPPRSPPPPPPRARSRLSGTPLDSRSNDENIPLSLVHPLSRLQESLQSLSETTAVTRMGAARRRIRDVRFRISDILARLEGVSGYRERLQSLRAQIVRAAARMVDPSGEEEQVMAVTDPQWDLIYCLWLVDMSLRLTNQMQRILSPDQRSSRFQVMRDRRRTVLARRRFDYERASRSASASAAAAASATASAASATASAATASSNLLMFESSDSESDSDNEGDRPNVPPFTLPPPFRPPQYNLPRYAGPGLGPLSAITHRIQYWSITEKELIPPISDPNAQLVVSTCKIHNDGSVDVSPCGQLLVALVPDAVGVTLAVFSLNSATMGQMLYHWGFGPNAVSVSFSPLSRYVVVGLASSRYMSPQREVLAQIFRLRERTYKVRNCSLLLEHVANMSQPLVGVHALHQLISLNCVRWLPNPGEGLVYGTNRGTLCICRPLCSVCPECSDDGGSSSRDETSSNLGTARRDSSFLTLSQHIEETATRHALLGRRS